MSGKKMSKFTKNDAGFTGLEAAIVLIAFVVVAAVFSYVMLGAGFFTSQKSKEVVHTGVDQATSSIQLAGDIVGKSDANALVDDIILTISLTAGNNPVDVGSITISGRSTAKYMSDLTVGNSFIVGTGAMLDANEMVELSVDTTALAIAENDELWLEVKPLTGATLNLHMTAPPALEAVMVLY